MSNINLTVNFEFPTGASSHTATYARIDNTLNPVDTTVPGIITSPSTIAQNIPNGQYRLSLTPVYPDGRECNPTTVFTPQCPGLISINAYLDGNNIILQYLAPSEVPKVRITVNYPNGGTTTANYVNNGNDIVVPLPNGVYGDFSVFGQSVCDEDSDFFSPISSQVTVTRTATNLTIQNNANNLSVIGVSGIAGFTLSQIISPGNALTDTHNAFSGGITVVHSGSAGVDNHARLLLNNTEIQCVDIPALSAADIIFTSASFSATDQLTIILTQGTC